MSNYTCYYVALMVVLSLLLSHLYTGYKHGFMTNSLYGSYHVLGGYEWLLNS